MKELFFLIFCEARYRRMVEAKRRRLGDPQAVVPRKLAIQLNGVAWFMAWAREGRLTGPAARGMLSQLHITDRVQ